MQRTSSLPILALILIPPWAKATAQGIGPTDDTARVSGLTIHFRPTYQQSKELDRLLADQQNPASPRYRAWLTAQEYGDRFGLTASEFAKVQAWILAQGFRVDSAAASRTYLSFSGTAEQVRRTFGAAREPVLPHDIAPLVLGLRGLDTAVSAIERDLARQAGAQGIPWIAPPKESLMGSKPGGSGDGILINPKAAQR